MKKFRFLSKWMLIACLAMLAVSCDKKNDSGDGGDGGDENQAGTQQILFNNNELGNGRQHFHVTEKGQYTLKKGTYVMKGWIYLNDGVTLNIEPGTVIKGDKTTMASLIALRGGKINARGTATEPIVFTSNQTKGERKPGDWGGIILCGKAPNNWNRDFQIEGGPAAFHGGDDANDNSGVLSYVRIEFPGYPFGVDQEINGLTMGSVGKGTQIDHIQISYSNDDSYEWFGGTVDCKYLVAYHGWDDDFDTDNGFSGRLQFLLGARNPKIADTSLSNGFESDNNKDGTSIEPFTRCVFSNVTLVGPIGQATDFTNTTTYVDGGGMNPNNNSKLGIFQSAMQIRRESHLNCFNSVAMGYLVGLILDNEKGKTQDAATAGKLKLQNLHFAGMTVLGSDINKNFTDKLSTNGKDIADASKESFSSTFFKLAANNNKSYAAIADLKLKQPNSKAANPNYGPSTGSPLLTGAAFTDALVADSWFEKVSYAGAFKSDADTDNWMKGWTNFDPQNTAY